LRAAASRDPRGATGYPAGGQCGAVRFSDSVAYSVNMGGVGFTLKIGGVFPQYMYLNGVFLCICVVL
jgi:hypothetical protein